MLKITSAANPRIRHAQKLREGKERQHEGLSLIEGEREILAALDAGVRVSELFVCETYSNPSVAAIVKRCAGGKCEIYEVASKVFGKIAYGEKKEGLVAVARIAPRALKDLPRPSNALFLVIEQVEKPGNLGAILRTADGCGVTGVIVCDPATDIYNPNAIRASLGAVFTLPVVAASNEEARAFLKERQVVIVATSPAASKPYWSLEAKRPMALVLGSEHQGLSPFWLKNADETVAIPMKGRLDSLNVSVSTAVILYDIIRKRS